LSIIDFNLLNHSKLKFLEKLFEARSIICKLGLVTTNKLITYGTIEMIGSQDKDIEIRQPPQPRWKSVNNLILSQVKNLQASAVTESPRKLAFNLIAM
jgi:hypothetical protein